MGAIATLHWPTRASSRQRKERVDFNHNKEGAKARRVDSSQSKEVAMARRVHRSTTT